MLQLKSKNSLRLDGYTVIIPSICVGNAAQLACDLLIASKKLSRIGVIFHSALIPVFGPSPYDHDDEKAASCELYVSSVEKLLVVQIRAPLISRHSSAFHKFLANVLKKAKRCVVLSGSFGFEKRVVESSPYAYRASEQFKENHKTRLETVKWKEFTGKTIFGGGNSLQLYQAIEEEQVPVMLLFRYLLDGDNSMDASLILRELSELFQSFLQLQGEGGDLKLTVPISWKLLFGNEVGELIF